MANEPAKKPPITAELAPSTEGASLIADAFLKTMANPDRVLQTRGYGDMQVYTELLRDDNVVGTLRQRRLSVVAAEWDVEPGADDATSKAAAEALKANLKAINWDAVTEKQWFGIFYGYSVAEVMWGVNDGLVSIDAIKVRDRARFRFNLQGDLFLRKQDFQYEQMPDRKFWTINAGADHSDNPYGVGLAHHLYWPVYFKRTDIKFWLIFLEKFGMPTAVGKMPGSGANEADRTKLLQALRAISTETGVVIPEGAEVELLEAVRGGQASYEAFQEKQDQAIAKVVLSQVMTSEAVGGQYKAEIQGGILDKVIKSDADLLCESFNQTVGKWWTEYNFPGAKPPRVWRNCEPPEDLNKRAERDAKIFSLGYEPTDEYILQTYGEGWVKKPEPDPATLAGAGGFQAKKPANFSEGGSLSERKARLHRAQNAIEAGAAMMGGRWQQIIGPKLDRLTGMLEETGDLATFREQLAQLLESDPSPADVEAIAQADFAANTLGRLSAQKDQPVTRTGEPQS